jgi:hypothetical protein
MPLPKGGPPHSRIEAACFKPQAGVTLSVQMPAKSCHGKPATQNER